ncbi:MAG TPA: FlgD immunoglobulin-like domain containing protein [Polyangia bacterium]|nr:FlgD immunoglobulin-like domain containing protein [Polyangia bacterium]
MKDTLKAVIVTWCVLSAGVVAAESPTIGYELRAPGRVSVAVYDHSGALLRTLLSADEQAAGPHALPWDGRDEAGAAVPAGDYAWKLLSTPGFSAEYLMSPGASYAVDPKGPYWALSPGSHGGPQALAVDATGFYVGAFSENIETSLLKQSLDGKSRLWTDRCPAPWTGPTSLARVGDTLWVYSANNGKIYRYATATGALVDGALGGTYDAEVPSDMAVGAVDVVLSYPKHGLVRWLRHDGTESRKVAVPGATAVDVAADGTVYVTAGTNVLQIPARATSAHRFLVGLEAPRRAAINPKNGDLYVVEAGDSNRVKRFSRAGVLQQTYGRRGGRTDGLYQPQRASFRGVTDVAVGANGDFWVAEGDAAPRRVAHFDRAGRWLAEWYGGQTWAPWIVAEPDNPRFVWMASAWGDTMRLDLDFAAKTWSVHSCYRYEGMANGLIAKHNHGDVWEARVRDGVLYLLRAGYPSVIKVDRLRWTLTPASVAINGIVQDPRNAGSPPWVKAQAAAHGPVSQSMLWTDLNGDGQALNPDGSLQANECQFFPTVATWPRGVLQPGHGFDYVFDGGSDRKIMRYSVGAWTASGAPSYASFPKGEVVAEVPPRFAGPFDPRWSSYLTTDVAGRLWGAFNSAVTSWGASTDSFIARYDADGRLVWTTGRRGGVPGTFNMLRRSYGVINDCLVFGALSHEWPAEGVTPVYVYDEDGLDAGPLLDRPVPPSAPSWRYGLGGEALAGAINKDARGDVYFFGTWINEARVYKISGWDGWQTARGTVHVTEGHHAPAGVPRAVGVPRVGAGLLGRYYASTDWTGAPVVTRVDPTLDDVWNPNDGSTAKSPTRTSSYSVRWTGRLTPRRTGWHMLRQTRGGGPPSRYVLDGISFNDAEAAGRAIWLETGRSYPIEIDYTNARQHPSIANGVLLEWSEPASNGVFTTIPTSQLRPSGP